MWSWTSPKTRRVIIGPVPAATSTYPSRTTHFAGESSCDRHCERSLPSNSTMASDGGGSGGRSGPGSTTGGRGRSIECTGHCWAVIVAGASIRARVVRNAECGVRNVSLSVARRSTLHCNSAFHTPHSALWSPGSLRHRRHEPFDARRRKVEGLPLLGAHVGRHQDLYDLQPVVERQQRRLATEEHAHEVPILGVVAVSRRLARHHGHEPHLGVLLLHQVLARLPFHLATEEELQPAVERVP